MPRAGYASITVTEDSQRQLQRRTYQASAQTGRRVTMANLIKALDTLADRHNDELLAIINETSHHTH